MDLNSVVFQLNARHPEVVKNRKIIAIAIGNILILLLLRFTGLFNPFHSYLTLLFAVFSLYSLYNWNAFESFLQQKYGLSFNNIDHAPNQDGVLPMKPEVYPFNKGMDGDVRIIIE